MTREPKGPREPGLGPELDETQAALERYASETAEYPARELAERVMRAVDAEPLPRRGLLATLFPSRPGGASTPMRLALLLATVMAAAVLALAAGGISQLLQRNVGSSPSQAVTQSAAPSASEEPNPTPTTTPSATPASPSATASSSPGSVAPSQSGQASPSESDDHESETPEPTRTPRPSETPEASETPDSD